MKKKYIELSVPNLIGKEKKYLEDCIKSNYVSSIGSYVKKFERKIGNYTKSKFTVSCNSGTSALHLGLKVCGVKKNDEVIVPTISFIATANAVRYLDAKPIFFDCDEFYNLKTEEVLEFIKNETYLKNKFTYNKKTKNRISALLIVHALGNAARILPIIKICKKHNIKVIEDAAGAMGTTYNEGVLKGKHVGTIADVGCFSFNGNKIITCGGGGALITNNKSFYKEALYLSTQANDVKLDYTHNAVGYNYRLTNLQAAVGLAQFENLKKFLKKKKEILEIYKNTLQENDNLQLSKKPLYASNNNWMITIKVKFKKKNMKLKLIKRLKKKNIETRCIWKPIHLQEPYKTFQKYKIQEAIKIFDSTILIPSSTNLTKKEIKTASKIILSSV